MTILMTAPTGEMLDRPEAVLAIRPDAPAGIPIDAIECALSRADATLLLLMDQFEGSEPTTFSNKVIVNALWSVQGLLEQVRILANNQEIKL